MISRTLEEDFRIFKPPFHAAIICGTREDFNHAARAFAQVSTTSGRQCLWIKNRRSLPSWSGNLPENSLIAGAWATILGKSGNQLSGAWKPFLVRAGQAALDAGFSGLDLILDFRRLPPKTADAVEKRLGKFFQNQGASSLCLYSLPPAAVAVKMLPLRQHPFLISNGRLCENIFSLPSRTRRRETLRSRPEELYFSLKEALGRIEEFQRRCEALKREGLQAETRYRKLVESARDMVFHVSPEGRLIYINPAVKEVLGYSPEEFYSDPGLILKIIHPEDRPKLTGMMDRILRDKDKGEPIETRWIHRDGHLVYLEHVRTAIFDDPGRLLEMIGISRDITARKQAEERLLASEALYRALFENAPEALILQTLEGKILDVNAATARLLGLPRRDLIGRSMDQLAPARIRSEILRAEEMIRREGQFEGELELADRDNRQLQVEVRGSRFRMGGEHRVLLIVKDITGRKRAETELREAEELYRSLVESCPEGIVFGNKGQNRFANPAFAAIFGFDHPREIIGEAIFDLVAPEERERVKRDLNLRALNKKTPLGYEFKGRHRSGKTLDLAVSLSQFTLQGEVYTQAVVRDISSSKFTEAALSESEEKYRRLAAAAPALICQLSPEGRTLYVNEHAFGLTGYRPEEILGRNWWQVFYPGELRDQVEKLYRDFQRGDVVDYEMTLQCKDGRRRTLAWNSTNRLRPEGAIQEIFGVGLDVTARRQAEAEQTRLREQLLQAQKMEAISSLAGGIAHDFNNLLGAILGQTSLLKMKLGEDDPGYRPVDVIEQAAQRASELTRQLSSFARQDQSASQPVNLNQVTGRVLAVISRTFDPALAVETRLEDDLWPVAGDAGRLEHMLLNLCLNAREAMPEGGNLTLAGRNLILDGESARSLPGVKAGAYVLLSVSHTGQGIPAEDLPRIFEPFYPGREGNHGSGLGLAMVYGIVTGHQGHIQADSRPGRGASFQIYLPALTEHRVEQPKAESKTVPHGAGTVLVVEDEALVRETLGKELASLGYRPLLAASGEEAVAILRQPSLSVALVILDWTMPGISGKETFFRLLQLQPSLKILLSSGYSQDSQIQEILRAGARGFLQKPYLIQELAETLREVLEPKPA